MAISIGGMAAVSAVYHGSTPITKAWSAATQIWPIAMGPGDSTLVRNFMLGSMPSGVTIGRASIGWRWSSQGVLEEIPANQGRLDYDVETGALLGLLMEPAATNLIAYGRKLEAGRVAGEWVASNITASDIIGGGEEPVLVLDNSIAITDKSGVTQTNYPLQFARPFVQGEIANYPQVKIAGVAVATQADVKQRYSDGSVKHAIIAVVVPTIPANGSVEITFQNQTSGNNTALSQSAMLAVAGGFDAKFEFVGGVSSVTGTISARTMLQAGHYTAWTQGQIAQTILLADHSTARVYDVGGPLRSIRPIFHATFWPTLGKVFVRFVAENINTETLQDLGYSVVLRQGLGNTQVYSNTNIPHYLATRWTKSYWQGGTPEPKININHNLEYLRETRFFMNYDTSLTVPDSIITSLYSSWLASQREPFQEGFWTKYMPTSGGTARPEIGPCPEWFVLWLYTGDWRAREVSLVQAELAGTWPMQVREGDTAKKIDAAQTISGLGKPISIKARPSLRLFDSPAGTAEDAITVNEPRLFLSGTTRTGGGWVDDGSHQPDPFSAQYTVTGDFFFLEQMQLWASAQAVKYNRNYRSPAGGGQYAGIASEQVRGWAWVFRNRTHAAFLSPDGTPERAYFYDIVNDAIALWEKDFGITGTPLDGHALKAAGVNTNVSPLHMLGGTGHTGDIKPNYGVMAMWMYNFFVTEIGHALERGFMVDGIHAFVAECITNQFVSPGYDPHLYLAYRHPIKYPDGTFIPTWAEVQNGFLDAAVINAENEFPGAINGYTPIAYATTTVVRATPNGDIAYQFLKDKAYIPLIMEFAEDPKWALLPREAAIVYEPPPETPPPEQTTAGSFLTATVANGTIMAQKAAAANIYTFSAWVRRNKGYGRVDVTLDGGASWVEMTAHLLGGKWARIGTHLQSNGQTLQNPKVGFRLGEAGDIIEVDYCQLEAGPLATSEIPTTGATKTRSAESLQFFDIPGTDTDCTWHFFWPDAAVLRGARWIRNVTISDVVEDTSLDAEIDYATDELGHPSYLQVIADSPLVCPPAEPEDPPDLARNFMTGTMPQSCTVTRSSTAWRWNSSQVLVSASANVGRLDHDPEAGTLLGLLVEPAATNLLIHGRTLEAGRVAGEWAATSLTAADNVAGLDGVANKGSTLTATAANGRLLAEKTAESNLYTFSAWVKRKVGYGRVDVTLDGGTTWIEMTAHLLGGAWVRIGSHLLADTRPITNPSVGFRLGESGDAIEVDLCQLETGPIATSEIPTEGTATTRAQEVLRVANITGAGSGYGYTFAWPEAAVLRNARWLRSLTLSDVQVGATLDVAVAYTTDQLGKPQYTQNVINAPLTL